MKVFSFCIYGTERNYYDGLLENINLIREHFPDFEIYIYKGICDPSWVFDDTLTIIETGKDGAINMLYRYLPIKFADIGFVRDADSRVTPRDRWCIHQFLKSDKAYHIIRDHYFHKSPIMGGIFGWKSIVDIELDLEKTIVYSEDMKYLENILYPIVKSNSLVHSCIYGYLGEHVEIIAIPHSDQYDFVGNVIWDGKPKFEYFIGNIITQIEWLKTQDQHILIQHISNLIVPLEVPYHSRKFIFDTAYIANFYLGNIAKCQYWLSQFEFAEIDSHTYFNSSFLFDITNKKIIASFDPDRVPGEDEIVIVYGNYPDWHHALPFSSKIYRNVSLFHSIRHSIVEYDPAWEPVDTIYIVNLETRPDRYNDVLISLCNLHAPIHRVFHYKAQKDNLDPYIGASQNHVDVMKHFSESSKNYSLVLEDDIVFTENHTKILEDIREFFKRKYTFNLCFLALSKHGMREYYDDLLSITNQECTTSSAYFLAKETVKTVMEVACEGVENMKQTGNCHSNCIDRYWSKLPFKYYFKQKLAFQRPSFSNLTQKVNFNLD
jgi:hypothetical protein